MRQLTAGAVHSERGYSVSIARARAGSAGKRSDMEYPSEALVRALDRAVERETFSAETFRESLAEVEVDGEKVLAGLEAAGLITREGDSFGVSLLGALIIIHAEASLPHGDEQAEPEAA